MQTKGLIMARVRDTVLYKSIAPFVKSITKKQLQAELTKTRAAGREDNYPVMLNQSRLFSAFLWSRTPQGLDYWSALYLEINTNKGKANEPNH